MENPFKNDEKFINFTDKNNCKYAVVHYDWDYNHDKDSFSIVGFADYKAAFDAVLQISEGGLWVYLIDVTNNDVIMYLTGWCTKNSNKFLQGTNMHTISYSDYFDRLNHELNTWNGILAIIEHILEKCNNITNEVTTLGMVHDIAEIHKQSLLEEMQSIANYLAEDGVETGLVVSPIVIED